MMMNVKAFFLLVSSLGAVMFFSPEPNMRRINNEVILVEAAPGVFNRGKESTKKAAEDVVNTASEYAKQTGEGIRHVGSTAYERISSTGKDAEESSKLAASEYGSRLKDAREDAGEYAHHGTVKARDSIGDTLHSLGDHAYSTADSVRPEHESIINAKLNKAKEYMSHGASRAQEGTTDALHSTGDVVHSAAEKVKPDQHESVSSKLHKAKEIVKERVHEAAEYQPNLGQGLGYYHPDETHDDYHLHKMRDGTSKVEDYLEGARSSAQDAMEKAADALGLLRNQIKEIEPHEQNPTMETARSRICEYYDITKDAVVGALTRKEEQIGSSLESAKHHVESYYESAKAASLESLENQKERLGHYLDAVRLKLNAGREAMFNYGLSKVQQGKAAVQHGKDAVVEEKNKIRDAVQHGKDAVSREKDRIVQHGKDVVQHGKDAVQHGKDKVDQTFKEAGRWAHEKMVKLNQTEEMAMRICRQWIHKSVAVMIRLLHLFVFSSVFGSALWVTFVSGFVLSRNISRQQFGLVQSKIFPVYFRVVGSGITVLLATHMLLHPLQSAGFSELLQYYNLATCLALTLLNTFVLEPRLTKVMFEKLRLEKEEGRGMDASSQVPVIDEQARAQLVAVTNKLQTLHAYSSAANLAVLAGMTWHLWYLNCRLVI